MGPFEFFLGLFLSVFLGLVGLIFLVIAVALLLVNPETTWFGFLHIGHATEDFRAVLAALMFGAALVTALTLRSTIKDLRELDGETRETDSGNGQNQPSVR